METNILLPKPPKIIKKGESQAIFEIENCYPGYGMTLGNALRRVLLSSLRGAAVTSVKIQGVDHEFSTIPYVLEDVIQIILNLKQVRFKLHSEGPVILSLKAKGEKKVKASDIKISSDVEVINTNAHIATLTNKKAEIEIEIEVNRGLGYAPVEQRRKEKLAIGSIAVDAIFSPLKKVNYEIENMRVGDRTDFNRLRLDIETDGSISPEEAFTKAAQILVDHFNLFIGPEKEQKSQPMTGQLRQESRVIGSQVDKKKETKVLKIRKSKETRKKKKK